MLRDGSEGTQERWTGKHPEGAVLEAGLEYAGKLRQDTECTGWCCAQLSRVVTRKIK